MGHVKFNFDNHILDADLRELRRGGEMIAMQPQVFDLLVHLLMHRDRVVSRGDLIALVWGGRIVSDSTLDSRINAARSAIGDNPDMQISRIRLSDKTSRLHPRHVVPKPA